MNNKIKNLLEANGNDYMNIFKMLNNNNYSKLKLDVICDEGDYLEAYVECNNDYVEEVLEGLVLFQEFWK